jgi:hypothetical protein
MLRLFVAAGAEGLRKVVSLEDPAALEGGIVAYNLAITSTFYLVAASAGFSFFCALGMSGRV